MNKKALDEISAEVEHSRERSGPQEQVPVLLRAILKVLLLREYARLEEGGSPNTKNPRR